MEDSTIWPKPGIIVTNLFCDYCTKHSAFSCNNPVKYRILIKQDEFSWHAHFSCKQHLEPRILERWNALGRTYRFLTPDELSKLRSQHTEYGTKSALKDTLKRASAEDIHRWVDELVVERVLAS